MNHKLISTRTVHYQGYWFVVGAFPDHRMTMITRVDSMSARNITTVAIPALH